MKTPTQRAIELSIEGGWKIDEQEIGEWEVDQNGNFYFQIDRKEDTGLEGHIALNLLDPAFWECLGKALWWTEKCLDCDGDVTRKDTSEYPVVQAMGGISWCPERCPNKRFSEGYVANHHRFIDLLHDGKTIDEALESIIGKG